MLPVSEDPKNSSVLPVWRAGQEDLRQPRHAAARPRRDPLRVRYAPAIKSIEKAGDVFAPPPPRHRYHSAMPSRAAHRAALRRFKEPSVLPPEGMESMPALPAPFAWRNTANNRDYDRNEWEAYYVAPGGSETIARVNRLADGSCNVRLYAPPGFMDQQIADIAVALNLVADWAHRHPRKE